MQIKKNKAGKFVIDYTCQGHRITRVVGQSKREAEAAAAAIKADIIRGLYKFPKQKRILFESQAKEFLELHSKQNKRSSRRDEVSLGHLQKFFKGQYLADISPDLIERYRLKRKADGVSPATINREIACLKTLFTKAIEWGKAETNPVKMVKKFRETGQQERILNVEETKRLLGAARAELRPIIVLALNTGMRKSEILALRWSNADLLKGYILIEDSKSGRSRKIPMNHHVLGVLGGRPQRGEYVFLNPETGASTKDVKTAFRGACRRAKIKGLRFHDLRHTAATRMIEAGVDLVTVSKILGHASIQMTMRYAHPTPENMRLAVQKLGEFYDKSRETPERVKIRPPVSHLKSFN